MRKLIITILAVVAMLGVFSTGGAASFEAYDGMRHYTSKPDLTPYGLPPITMVYEAEIPRLRASAVRTVARQYASSTERIVLDIESLCVDIRSCSKKTVDRNIAKLKEILAAWRAESPGTRLGFYGLMPLRDYWSPVTGNDQAWKDANAYLKTRLAPYVDFVAPSLYDFAFSATPPYGRPERWPVYAGANIEQARIYGKPVIPFLWMLYHPNGRAITEDPWIEDWAWRQQLDFVRDHADGVIIWGGWSSIHGRSLLWDQTAPWWIETQRWLLEPQAVCR